MGCAALTALSFVFVSTMMMGMCTPIVIERMGKPLLPSLVVVACEMRWMYGHYMHPPHFVCRGAIVQSGDAENAIGRDCLYARCDWGSWLDSSYKIV
uniref:Secreted protein n=1 Tax=Caenorhabditis japonica TaxID=281687 RepID=A0A8R1I9L4_CAEJA